MVDRCFRAQHPEVSGREAVPEPMVPPTLRYGPDRVSQSRESLEEDAMGHPDAVPLED